nr:hypothetical protein [uncultured Carboxylicivirga sp.]
MHIIVRLAEFVKQSRKVMNLSQEGFANRAVVALIVVRTIEHGKSNLNLDEVNPLVSIFRI